MATVLGMEIGATAISAAPVDTKTGDLLTEHATVPTPAPATPDAVVAATEGLVRAFDWTGRTGVAVPMVVKDHVARTATHLDRAWIGLDPTRLLSSALGVTTTVVNDADAAGIAEMEFGAARGNDGVVVVLTLGAGIGSAVFSEGVLVPHTELGRLDVRGKPASRRVSADQRERKGLSWAQYAASFDEYLAAVTSLVWPDLVVVGGVLGRKAHRWLPLLSTTTPIVGTTLGATAGVAGAALAAHRAQFDAS